MSQRRRLEFGVVVLLFAIVALIYADGYRGVLASIEGYTFKRNLEEMRTQAAITLLEKVQVGESAELQALEGANPVELLDEPPARYRGERAGAAPDAFEPGEWYFDIDEGVLVYRVEYPRYFTGGAPGEPARIRLRVSVQPHSSNWLDVEPVEPYAWEEQNH